MDELDAYLRGPFLADWQELHTVRGIADEALKTLNSFGIDGKWPYEVAQETTPKPSDSESTATMILFSAAVAAGKIPSSVLVPFVTPRNQNEMPSEVRDLHKRVADSLQPAIEAILLNTETRRGVETFEVTTSGTFGPDDPFTLLWLFELLFLFKGAATLQSTYEKVLKVIEPRVSDVFSSPSPASFALKGGRALEHMFPVLRVVQLSVQISRSVGTSGPSHARLVHYLQNRLHLHLSYFSIPDSSYDAAELAFAMEAILLLDPHALDTALVDRCMTVIDESQHRNPYWRPLRPFIANQQGMVLLPLSVEIANSLIRSCEILDKRDRSHRYTSRYIGLFRRYTEWLFTRVIRGAVEDGTRFLGWHSEHADDPGKIHLWETSQVLLYLLHYEGLLRRHRARTSLTLINLAVLTPTPGKRSPISLWDEGPRGREPLSGISSDSEYAIYQRIGDSYIRPRSAGESLYEPHFSMLLYGPQGTGKTTLAEDIAKCLGQPLITVTPSDFTVRGGAEVEARAKAIFDVLGAQTDSVILLDEIDRLILDRDSQLYQKQSDLFQFMTPGMLTKFRNLRREQRVIFIVSTNYAERIDPAIKKSRPNRRSVRSAAAKQ